MKFLNLGEELECLLFTDYFYFFISETGLLEI